MSRRRTEPPPRQPSAFKPLGPAVQPGVVASFSCLRCGCQDEVRLPCPDEIPCWGDKCKAMMRRWFPHYEPPIGNARIWDGKARKS